MENKDLVNKTTADLIKLEEEARAELFALRFQASIGNLEKPHRIRALKRMIAQILTILSERKAKGENTNLKVKVDLQETMKKVEEDAQKFVEKRRAEVEAAMAEQQQSSNNLNDQLDAIDLDDVELPTPVAPAKTSKTTKAKQATNKGEQ